MGVTEDPRPDSEEAPTANAVVALVLIAACVALAALSTRFALAPPIVPAAVAGLIFGGRFPVAAVLSLFGLTGAIGTIQAFTPVPPAPMADLLLVGLWAGVAARYLTGGWQGRLWLWPGVLAPGVYIFLSVIIIPLADPISLGVEAFRNSVWYMLAMVLLIVAPWPSAWLAQIQRGMVAITALIGAYCAYRYFGPDSIKESVVAREAQPTTPGSQELRFFGTQPSAQQLASFFSTVVPMCLALGLAWAGRWRATALLASALGLIAILASDIRTGIAAVGGGIAVVIVLFLLSQAFRSRIHVGVIALLAIGAVGLGGYSVTIATDEVQAERFSNLFSPNEDYAFAVRERRWGEAMEVIEETPLGHGLGTQGSVAYTQRDDGAVGPANIDSSYLKIGIEQGVWGFAAFALGLLALLAGLIRRGIVSENAQYAAPVIGAAGALVAYALSMYGSTYIESLTALTAWLVIGMGAAVTTHAPDPARVASPAPTPHGRGQPVLVGGGQR